LVHKLENIFLIAFEEETLQSGGVGEAEKVGKIVKTDISGTDIVIGIPVKLIKSTRVNFRI